MLMINVVISLVFMITSIAKFWRCGTLCIMLIANQNYNYTLGNQTTQTWWTFSFRLSSFHMGTCSTPCSTSPPMPCHSTMCSVASFRHWWGATSATASQAKFYMNAATTVQAMNLDRTCHWQPREWWYLSRVPAISTLACYCRGNSAEPPRHQLTSS